jgi:hypothetical protein
MPFSYGQFVDQLPKSQREVALTRPYKTANTHTIIDSIWILTTIAIRARNHWVLPYPKRVADFDRVPEHKVKPRFSTRKIAIDQPRLNS